MVMFELAKLGWWPVTKPFEPTRQPICEEAGCPELVRARTVSEMRILIQHGENPEHRREFDLKTEPMYRIREWFDDVHAA